jgi:small GTP-binding protein
MPKSYKVVVTGVFNAGKTTFVNTLSEIEPVNTDKATRNRAERKIKPTTTVALDYGRVKISQNHIVHLFGTPGQDRFDFMREILAEDMQGFIFLVDSTDRPSLDQATELLATFERWRRVPYLLAVNKADCQGLSGEEIRKVLKLPAQHPVVPCVATNRASVRAVVERLIALIETTADRGQTTAAG